jgi:hypothetical protein
MGKKKEERLEITINPRTVQTIGGLTTVYEITVFHPPTETRRTEVENTVDEVVAFLNGMRIGADFDPKLAKRVSFYPVARILGKEIKLEFKPKTSE